MRQYHCPKCGASAFSSASPEMVRCPTCSEPLADVSPDTPAIVSDMSTEPEGESSGDD